MMRDTVLRGPSTYDGLFVYERPPRDRGGVGQRTGC
jgi:hypothetical protein